MLNYLKYFIVFLLFYSLFYTYSINISKETLQEKIDLKTPMIIYKKGFIVTVTQIKIENITDNVIQNKILGNVKANDENILTRVFKSYKNKQVQFELSNTIKPYLDDSFLSFSVLSLNINNFIKIKNINKHVRNKIEKIKIPLKVLKKVSWFASVKKIHFKSDDNLTLEVGISKLLLSLLIPLFLLREIGLFIIYFYQKFLSPRKKYKCAKGELYQKGTCSSSTKEAFKKYGFIRGIKEYRKSTKKCREAYKTLNRKKKGEGSSSFDCCNCTPSSGDGGSSSSACDLSPSCDIGGC